MWHIQRSLPNARGGGQWLPHINCLFKSQSVRKSTEESNYNTYQFIFFISKYVSESCNSTLFVALKLLSHVQFFTIPWTAAHQVSLSFTVSWSLLKLMSIGLVMPSNYLVLPSNSPSIRVFSSESALGIRWPKYWSFSFSISPSNEYLGLIYLHWLVWSPCCPRDSQQSSPALQCETINSLVLSLFYGSILTSVYDYWKNHDTNQNPSTKNIS